MKHHNKIQKRTKTALSEDDFACWLKGISSNKLSATRAKEIYESFDTSKWGWLTRFAVEAGVSHFQARRLITEFLMKQNTGYNETGIISGF